MDSLQVRTGQVSLRILDDSGEERGIFKFNPQDVESAKKVFDAEAELEKTAAEFDKKAEACQTSEEKIDLLNEAVTYYENMIDNIFGIGSSQVLFGTAKTLSMFEDFFQGIMPYYQKASDARMSKYKRKSSGK